MTIYLDKAPRATQALPMSDAEREARVQLAACYRIFDMFGWVEQIFNHITVRVPGPEVRFLINPFGLHYREITASNLLLIDTEGHSLRPSQWPVNRAGFVIHSAIHKAKHDIACVAHTHTWPGMAVSTLECGLLPNTQTSMRFAHISYHDFSGVVLDLSEQERLVRDLGDNNAMILRNHGLLTVGNTIPECFNALHRLELSCKTQIAAMSCNSPMIKVPDEVVEKTWLNYQPQTRRPFGVLDWPALLRKLDRIDPSYRD
jgi:ribulose-5-phosphate 4-epimerase/fuculose-1-phosphate aldolase